MRYLLIEDEPGIAQFIIQGLTELGHVVTSVEEGDVGLDFAIASAYDVIILDIMLPNMDGLQVLRHYRQAGGKTPILLLSAKSEIEDRVKGLDAGADDYLPKPFAFQELFARLSALQRRPPLQKETLLKLGDLSLDVALHQVQRGGQQLDLSVREFALLEMFLRHPNHVLSRTQIAQHVWNFDYYNDTNVVDVYVGYLRKKIDQGFDVPLIHTIRGIGYKLSLEN